MESLMDKARSTSAHLRRVRNKASLGRIVAVSLIAFAAWVSGGDDSNAARAQTQPGDVLDSLRDILREANASERASPERQAESTGLDDASSNEQRASEWPDREPDDDASGDEAEEDAPEAAQGPQESQYIRVGVDDRVTMHVTGMPLADALRMLSEPRRQNIILADGLSGTVSASFYDASFESALTAILVSNGLGYRVDGDFIFVHTLADLAQMREASRKVKSRIFRLSYVTASSMKTLVEPMLSQAGSIVMTPAARIGLGGDSGPDDTEGDNLAAQDTIIVTDYESRLDEVAKLIHELDVRPQQVLIEATILRATLNEDNALGIDFTTVGGVDFTTLGSTSPAAQSIATGQTPVDMMRDTTFTARTDFNTAMPSGGFTFGIIKDQISLFIRALEQITDTDVMANPKVLALNKQFGQVIVGQRDGYITTTVTESTAVQSVEFLETGTILSFRPFIGNDGFIRMEIHPKDSTGGLTQSNLPFEQTTEVTTNVMVKDGHTILIGGLFREVSTATRGQMPLLGNLPVAGALFRSTSDTTTREEVIILLTVRIIKDTEDTEASEQLLDDVETYRVGMRRGMQWFGRERLAQSHYARALEHLAAGEIDDAIWDAEIAVNNFPRHIHALKLLEKLRGRRAWESEASSIRTYVRDRIMHDLGIDTPAFGRPGPPFVLPEGLEGPSGFEEEDQTGASVLQKSKDAGVVTSDDSPGETSS